MAFRKDNHKSPKDARKGDFFIAKKENMKEALIKPYTKDQMIQMRTLENSLEYTLQAEEQERAEGREPVLVRNDEKGEVYIVVADSEVRAMWKRMGWETAIKMQNEGCKKEVVDILNRYK